MYELIFGVRKKHSLNTCQRSYVPGDVVAPTDGLHPVDGAGVEPHQVAWSLDEPIDGHVGLVQVLKVGPPRAHEEVDVVPSGEQEKQSGDGCVNKGSRELVTGRHRHKQTYKFLLLFAEVAHHSPVGLRNCKPLTIPRSNVDVDGTEVIVFLVTWRYGQRNLFTPQSYTPDLVRKRWPRKSSALTWYPAPRDLHVELNRVHTHDGVSYVAEQVTGGYNSSKGGQLAEFL